VIQSDQGRHFHLSMSSLEWLNLVNSIDFEGAVCGVSTKQKVTMIRRFKIPSKVSISLHH